MNIWLYVSGTGGFILWVSLMFQPMGVTIKVTASNIRKFSVLHNMQCYQCLKSYT